MARWPVKPKSPEHDVLTDLDFSKAQAAVEAEADPAPEAPEAPEAPKPNKVDSPSSLTKVAAKERKFHSLKGS